MKNFYYVDNCVKENEGKVVIIKANSVEESVKELHERHNKYYGENSGITPNYKSLSL